MKKSVAALLLAAMLVLCLGAAGAEGAFDPYDVSCTVGDGIYVFPVPVSDLAASGLNVPDVSALEEGSYYPSVTVHDGTNQFAIRVEYCTETPDEKWATGFTLTAADNAGVTVGGLTLGETTAREAVELLGADSHGYTSGTLLSYYYADMNYCWNLSFESDAADATLKSVNAYSSLVANFGDVRTIVLNEADADLPNAADMTHEEFILCGHHYKKGDTLSALLDNGWKLEKAPDTEVEARRGNRVLGDHVCLYNGETFVKVSAYNTTETACALKDCVIEDVMVDTELKAEMVLSGNVKCGMTLDEAKAAWGEAASSKEKDGLTVYTFEPRIDECSYEASVNADGVIVSLKICDLM